MANKDITETGVRSVLETMGIPSSFQGFKENAIGRAEALATVGSSIAGTMAGMGGSVFEAARGGDMRAQLDTYRKIQDAMTYMPRTQGGLDKVQQIGEFFEPVGLLYEQYGEAVGESTGSPLLGEYAEELVDPLFFLGGIGGIPRRAGRIADAATDVAETAEALTDGLPAKPPEFVTPPEPQPAMVVTPEQQQIILSKPERGLIRSSVPRGSVPKVQEQVAGQKAAYPSTDGWAQDRMVVKNVKVKKDKKGNAVFEVDYQKTPYGFEKPPLGVDKVQWEQTISDRAVQSVRDLAERVKQGDPAARAILDQANWYRSMRTRLREEFGGIGDVFADALGATSANTGVEMNWDNAIEVMRRYSRGEFDKQINMYEDMLEQGITDPNKLTGFHKDTKKDFELITKASGALFGMNSPATTKALLDMFRVAEGAPKTPNFTGNLIGYTNAPTIDVWAARYLRRLAGKDRLPPPTEKGVTGSHLKGSTLQEPNVGGEFGFGQRVLTDAARRINQENIIGEIDPDLAQMNPDDLQAVAWFIEKELWTENGWTSKAGEGGSFDYEASLAGAADPKLIKDLRKTARASFAPPNKLKRETQDEYIARVEEAREAHMAKAAEAQAQIDEIKTPLVRYVLGVSVERPGQRPTNVQQAEVAARLGEPAMADESVVAFQVNNTYGRFMQEDERAFNAEFVTRANFNPEGVTRRMVEVAKEADQDAAFISKVVPQRTESSRPGVEIYFKNRQTADFARDLSDKLTEYGVDGFTFVTDARVADTPARQAGLADEAVAGINGLRFQYIPEFDVGADAWAKMSPAERAAKIDEMEDLFDDIAADIEKTEPGISSANMMHYETNVIERDQYDGLLGTPATTQNR